MKRFVDGKLPLSSMANTMNIQFVEMSEGLQTKICTPADKRLNPMGTGHGGFTTIVIDSFTDCAMQSALKAGGHYTLDFAL